MKRVVVPELLDTDAGTPQQITDSLDDLQWLNRNFGGISTTAALLRRITVETGARHLSFLDVAGATGDVAEGARDRLSLDGVALDVTVLDRASTHFARQNGRRTVTADALQLPFRDESFDVVGSALFLHHLEPQQIIACINESLRVARLACIINDLRRGYFHLLSAYVGGLLYKSPITMQDSVASVRRAYTRAEMRQILLQTSASSFDISGYYFCRMGAIVWKRLPNE